MSSLPEKTYSRSALCAEAGSLVTSTSTWTKNVTEISLRIRNAHGAFSLK